ncbi:MAG: protein kinase, partial [Candidatus Aminicenantales bacterium]
MRCPHCDSFVPEKSRFCSQCGSSLEEKKQTLTYTPAMASRAEERLRFSPGDRFGKRYRIVEEVGRGGMGRVYKAEDKELGITVALKMIRPELSSHSRFIRQFKRETLLARSISHENIIRIHDLGEVQKIKFISMDYIRGQDLRALIQTSGSLVPETAIHIARQICAALHAAHKEGIVHLDLKPQNIMIDSSGRVYVMDFGVARSLAVPQEGTSRAFIGTPPYMSPEQAQKKDVDQRADLYAFGVILFEMLTGRRPFEAETASEYIEKHIHEEPPLPSKINPLIPPFLDKVVLRCLEKDRTRRYQNAAEILEDLGRIKPGAKPALVRARTHAIWRWAAAFAVILVLALGLYLLIGRKKPGPPSFSGGERIPVAVMYFENNTGDEEFDHWRKALCYMIIQDLSQSYYVRVLTGDRLFSILRKLNLTDAETYSAEDLRNVAQEAGVRYIISGDYTKARETFRINAMLQDIATGELIGSTRIQGTGTESFLTMVDEITPWAKSKFNLTQEEIAADLDKNIGEITTTNPEALRFYIQGREYYQEGRIQESNEAFLKAVEKDPGFALAYKRISENYYYLGDIDLAKTYIQKS